MTIFFHLDVFVYHLGSCRCDDATFVLFEPSCEPNSDTLRDRSISFETIASWLDVSTSYLEVFRILMPYWASVERPSCEALLSGTRDCLDRPVTPSREIPSGDHETLPLVAPFDVPRKLGMYFIVKALSAGPLEAMIALRVGCQSFGQSSLGKNTYMLTSAPEMVKPRL